MNRIATTPEPPYYTVIFTSVLGGDRVGYDDTAARMLELAAHQPGFLGVESVRDETGFGVTVSYWASLEAIRGWKQHAEHQQAQRRGKESWYTCYKLRIAKVERDYGFDRAPG